MSPLEKRLIPSILAAVLTSCSTTQPSTFYMLNPLPAQALPTQIKADRPTVAVTLYRFPEYLNRSQIVELSTDNTVVLAETRRWAEPLRDNFARVLTENISTLLDTPAVIQGPAHNNQHVDQNVLIEVIRFDMGADRQVHLVARWAVANVANTNTASIRKSIVDAPVQGNGYDGVAAAHSEAVAKLSQEIADALQQVRKP